MDGKALPHVPPLTAGDSIEAIGWYSWMGPSLHLDEVPDDLVIAVDRADAPPAAVHPDEQRPGPVAPPP